MHKQPTTNSKEQRKNTTAAIKMEIILTSVFSQRQIMKQEDFHKTDSKFLM